MSKQVATIVLALLLAAGVGGAVGAGVALSTDDQPAAQSASPSTSESVSQSESSAAALYKREKDAVVEVHTTTEQGSATGSGFVIDKQGHIVTNEHVVEGATKVTVQFADQSEVQATIVGTDPSTDIAVLKVDRPASRLTPLSFASAGSLEVGDPVVAIGSPFGLDGTLTTGVVSGLGRKIEAPNGFTIENAVQTDAALNHGNSGGPLLDLQGRVVGVAAQIRSDSGGNVGIGYAVPGDTAQRVARELISDGSVEHAYLGVSLPDSGAATIEQVVNGSPADSAGVQAGDEVTAVDGKTIDSGDALREAIDAKKPGDKITLTIKRNGNERTVQVTLGQRPATAQ
ncbi:MAG TPA: trypsin-like peptidase domain-containing protein [Gaiellaceae bacterium]|nr:trypsin-like peptidase domain-containing protein [Gaiellaceae bacterium]